MPNRQIVINTSPLIAIIADFDTRYTPHPVLHELMDEKLEHNSLFSSN